MTGYPFAIRRHGESVVEGDEGHRRGLALSGDQGSGELHRFGRSEVVHAQQSDRDLIWQREGQRMPVGGRWEGLGR
jgi:hypothetical protein